MLYLRRGALSSEARFIVSFGMVWFGDRVVYPGLPSEDRAAKHMGKLLLAQLMASAQTPEPTQSCLQSQAGDKFLLQRWSAPQEPKTPKATSRNGKDKLALLSISFFKPLKPKNRPERGQGAVWHLTRIREQGCMGRWAGTRENLVLTASMTQSHWRICDLRQEWSVCPHGRSHQKQSSYTCPGPGQWWQWLLGKEVAPSTGQSKNIPINRAIIKPEAHPARAGHSAFSTLHLGK